MRRPLIRVGSRVLSLSLSMFMALLVLVMAGSVQARDDVSRREGRRDRAALERWRGATSEERQEMRAAIRERWEEATPRQRHRFGRRMKMLERRLPDFSTIERLILVRAAAELPEAERKSLRARIRRIDALEPEDRDALIAELQAMIAGYSGEIDRLKRNNDRWEGLSEAERQEFREQMRRLRSMTIEERRALLEEMKAAKERR